MRENAVITIASRLALVVLVTLGTNCAQAKSGGGNGKVRLQDIKVNKPTDQASPKLNQAQPIGGSSTGSGKGLKQH